MSRGQKLVVEELYLESVSPEPELLTTTLTCLSQTYNQISINIYLDALNSNH